MANKSGGKPESQPALSRFFNRMDETTLDQFYKLIRRFGFYCKHGTMENYIRENKNGFGFTAVYSTC